MRILYILNRIPLPLTDGGAICSYNSVKFLHCAGHQLTLLALNTNKHYQDPDVMRGVCDNIFTFDINTDISVLKAAQNLIFSSRPYIAERFHKTEFARLICNTIDRAISDGEPFDIIHIDHTMIAWYVDAIRTHFQQIEYSLPPPPIFLRTHNIEYLIQERLATHETNPAKRWYRKFLAQRMKRYETAHFHRFDGVMAITPEEAVMMRSFGYTGNLATIPAGVDVEEFSPQLNSTQFPNTLCYIGGMDWQPNIDAVHWFVNTVFPRLREHFSSENIQLHIAGKRMSAELQAYSNLEGVTMFPDVPSAADFLRARKILIVPLLSGGGMRLKIVEAMALGMPIISTRIGAEGINARHGESIMLADTPEEFLTAMKILYTQPDFCARIAAKAREIALREYSWQSIATRMEDFYTAVKTEKHFSTSL